jgi:hypothetical protein
MTRCPHFVRAACGVFLAALAAGAGANPAPALREEPPAHRWLAAPQRLEQPETYFTNLADGARIETPFVLRFGLSRFGLSPIVKDVPRTGHHHLLVNRDLPLDFKQPLPFNDQYIHFGKGQMETVLTFAPGTYTLRLLLADHKHIPYFIYSKPLRITVTAKRADVDPKTLVKPGVALLAPADGEAAKGPVRVRFHASGLNVGHAEVTEPNTGHFELVADHPGRPSERIRFANGATEAWLKPPAGDYTLRLQLVRNAAPQDVMAVGEPVKLRVLP